jgi:hypothetical protein
MFDSFEHTSLLWKTYLRADAIGWFANQYCFVGLEMGVFYSQMSKAQLLPKERENWFKFLFLPVVNVIKLFSFVTDDEA